MFKTPIPTVFNYNDYSNLHLPELPSTHAQTAEERQLDYNLFPQPLCTSSESG